MAGNERICPTCQKSFFGEDVVCPHDGAKLLIVGRASIDRAGQVIDDKVTLIELLATGGMGEVYRARQHSMEREVAVKLLHKSYSDDAVAVRRFLQEAKGASRLHHPNVITLFDFGQTDDGELYLMMELLTGRDLSKVLADEGPMPPERAVPIACQVCEALHHAHEAGLIHRDLKPENVILVQGSRRTGDYIKVLDFGIAKIKPVEGSDAITRTGVVCGTPAYMSPEQSMGEPIDRRSDVYSIGVMLYELLCGSRPFESDTTMKLLLAHANQAPPSLTATHPNVTVPDPLEAVVMSTLAKSPDDRPSTAGELADLLTAALSQSIGNLDTEMAVRTPTEALAPLKETKMVRALPVGIPVETGMELDVSPRRSWAPVALAVAAIIPLAFIAYQAFYKPQAADPTPPAAQVEQPPAAVQSDPPPPKPAAKAEPTPPPAPVPRRIAEAEPSTQAARSLELTAPPVAKPEPVTPEPIRVTSKPPGARVYLGSKLLGITPLTVQRPPAGQTLLLSLKLRGYRSERAVLTDTSEPGVIRLRKPTKRAPAAAANDDEGFIP